MGSLGFGVSDLVIRIKDWVSDFGLKDLRQALNPEA